LIAVDTKGLVRILADDHEQPAQVAAARALASEAHRVFVPTVVQLETAWVLESGYGLSKGTVVEVLDSKAVGRPRRRVAESPSASEAKVSTRPGGGR